MHGSEWGSFVPGSGGTSRSGAGENSGEQQIWGNTGDLTLVKGEDNAKGGTLSSLCPLLFGDESSTSRATGLKYHCIPQLSELVGPEYTYSKTVPRIKVTVSTIVRVLVFEQNAKLRGVLKGTEHSCEQGRAAG